MKKTKKVFFRSGEFPLRYWKCNSEEEMKIVTSFLKMCESKLTISQMHDFSQDKMRMVILDVLSKKTTIEALGELSPDQLYDFILNNGDNPIEKRNTEHQSGAI